MPRIILDTSAVVPRLDARDTLRQPAVRLWSSVYIAHLFADIVDLVGQHQGRLNFHDALLALEARELDIPYIGSFDPDFDAIPWLTRISSPKDLAGKK